MSDELEEDAAAEGDEEAVEAAVLVARECDDNAAAGIELTSRAAVLSDILLSVSLPDNDATGSLMGIVVGV